MNIGPRLLTAFLIVVGVTGLRLSQSIGAESEPAPVNAEAALLAAERLSDQVDIHQLASEFEQAEGLLLRILATEQQHLGLKNSRTAYTIFRLARLYQEQDRHAEAEQRYLQWFDLYTSLPDQNDFAIAFASESLGAIYLAQGRYDEAEPLYRNALTLWEKILGPDDPDVFEHVNNLALLYQHQGRYADAEPLYERALKLSEETYGANHPDTGAVLNNLAALYYLQGRVDDAEPLYLRALKIVETVSGPKHQDTGERLNNLAGIYSTQGRYDEAEAFYLRALDISEKELGPEHPNTGSIINNLALLYGNQGRFDDAEQQFLRALEIAETTRGPLHRTTGAVINNLATLYHVQGRYADAAPLYHRFLDVAETMLGPNHPDTGTCLLNVAGPYFDTGDSRVLEYAARAFEVESAVRSDDFRMLSERQRLDFVQFRGDTPLRIVATLAMEATDTAADAVAMAWSMALRSKGAVLDAMIEDRQNLAANPEAEPLYARLRDINSQEAHWHVRAWSEMTDAEALSEYRRRMDAIRQEKDDVEGRLARLSGRFREGRRASRVTAEQVGAALTADTVLVEFLHFTPVNRIGTETIPPRYVAFVLSHGDNVPELVILGDAEPIDRLIFKYRDRMQTGESVADIRSELHRLVWYPVAPTVGTAKRVLISPDGNLNQLAFAALYGPDGRYLVEDHEIGYLASSRDLVRRLDGDAASPPALFGDPDFGSRPALDFTQPGVFRSVPGDGDRTAYGLLNLNPLPATRREVEQLGRKLADRNPLVFLGAEAAEENLKALKRPDLLHLATHGFFLPEPETPDVVNVATPVGGQGPKLAGDQRTRLAGHLGNPMHRAGLALSGATASLAGNPPADRDDGIVTAEEVGGLDLWGTRLVVLSACDTAVGETVSGEGVLGLRRAFVQAGARNLMLTLWRVEDRYTRDLMLEFYREFLADPDAIAALSRVQRRLLTESEPRFWAPFLVSVQGSGGGKRLNAEMLKGDGDGEEDRGRQGHGKACFYYRNALYYKSVIKEF